MNKNARHSVLDTKSNIPKLRFPEFANSEEWEEKEISSLFNLDKKAKKIDFFDNNKIITVRLHMLGVVKNKRTSTLSGSSNYFVRHTGEFIFSKIDLLSGAFGLVPEELDGFYSSSDIPSFIFKNIGSSKFFLYWLSANYLNLKIERTGTSNTLKRVSPENFLKIKILIPSLPEQQKIADFLSSIDEQITQNIKKVELLKEHKKGLLQNLFPSEGENVPRLRFPEFVNDGEWEEKELGEIFQVTRGYVLSMNLVTDKQTEKQIYPVYSSQTKNKGLAGYYQEYLYENAITWTTDGANAGDVNYRKGKFYCTNVCGVLLNTKGYANICIAEIINSISKDYVSYVGNPKLMNGVMSKISIKIPSLPEQQKIADFLSSIDELITSSTKKVELLKEHKKGLMQQLFPSVKES
jgi:type I restriction enzyme S subunit